MSVTLDYLARTIPPVEFTKQGSVFESLRKSFCTANGVCISIQTSKMHYCSPRLDNCDMFDVKHYNSVELGFWYNTEDDSIQPVNQAALFLTNRGYFCDGGADIKRVGAGVIVFGYVKVADVDDLIEYLGGENSNTGTIVTNML